MKKYFRKCPLCNKELGYTNKKNRNMAEKKRSCCSSCSCKEVHKRPEIILRDKQLGVLRKKRYRGKDNPFYGKKHSEETRKKMRGAAELKDKSFCQTQEFKEKSRRPGKLNGMYGRTVYGVWLEKYGKREADKRMKNFIKKQSINSSGKNNPMYGKPAPQGSGNGWSGWYKKWYFRSLKELSYMINVIEPNKYKWRTAETRDLSIKYIDYKGVDRTYRADFFINEKILLEIKPIKLFNTPTNLLKKKAAINFCKSRGYKYRIVDIKLLSIEEIISLYKNKEIKFIYKYQNKMEKLLWKSKKSEQ